MASGFADQAVLNSRIKGKSRALELEAWLEVVVTRDGARMISAANEALLKVLDEAVDQVYP